MRDRGVGFDVLHLATRALDQGCYVDRMDL
jgi:hypothetical protein